MPAVVERKRRVGVQTLQPRAVGNPTDPVAGRRARRMAFVGRSKVCLQRWIGVDTPFESSDTAVGLDPVDLSDQVRTREVVGRWEWASGLVLGCLSGHRWVTERAPHRDGFQRAWLAADLPSNGFAVMRVDWHMDRVPWS